MRSWKRPLLYAAQSAIAGLALAFVVVLINPRLANLPAWGGRAEHESYADAVAASSPAVVSIYTAGPANAPYGVQRGLGSGVIVDDRGYLLTTYHVIGDDDQIAVQLADGRVAIPKRVGADPESEIALLKIDLPDLPSIELGRSDTLRVGDVVLAIGTPLGLSQSVTMGIVSATGRDQLDRATFENFIQTDAAINLGNSGGALVDTAGKLVGINIAVATLDAPQPTAPTGIGFAIPVNLIRGVMQELIEHGRVIRGYMGVDQYADQTRSEALRLGLDGPGVVLIAVSGPARQAGLAPGDIVTHIDGQRLENGQQATRIVASHKPGDRLHVRGVRIGRGAFETDVTLEERP